MRHSHCRPSWLRVCVAWSLRHIFQNYLFLIVQIRQDIHPFLVLVRCQQPNSFCYCVLSIKGLVNDGDLESLIHLLRVPLRISHSGLVSNLDRRAASHHRHSSCHWGHSHLLGIRVASHWHLSVWHSSHHIGIHHLSRIHFHWGHLHLVRSSKVRVRHLVRHSHGSSQVLLTMSKSASFLIGARLSYNSINFKLES